MPGFGGKAIHDQALLPHSYKFISHNELCLLFVCAIVSAFSLQEKPPLWNCPAAMDLCCVFAPPAASCHRPWISSHPTFSGVDSTQTLAADSVGTGTPAGGGAAAPPAARHPAALGGHHTGDAGVHGLRGGDRRLGPRGAGGVPARQPAGPPRQAPPPAWPRPPHFRCVGNGDRQHSERKLLTPSVIQSKQSATCVLLPLAGVTCSFSWWVSSIHSCLHYPAARDGAPPYGGRGAAPINASLQNLLRQWFDWLPGTECHYYFRGSRRRKPRRLTASFTPIATPATAAGKPAATVRQATSNSQPQATARRRPSVLSFWKRKLATQDRTKGRILLFHPAPSFTSIPFLSHGVISWPVRCIPIRLLF